MSEETEQEIVVRAWKEIMDNPITNLKVLNDALRDQEVEPCPACGEKDCTWMLIDTYEKILGRPGLR